MSKFLKGLKKFYRKYDDQLLPILGTIGGAAAGAVAGNPAMGAKLGAAGGKLISGLNDEDEAKDAVRARRKELESMWGKSQENAMNAFRDMQGSAGTSGAQLRDVSAPAALEIEDPFGVRSSSSWQSEENERRRRNMPPSFSPQAMMSFRP